ncbi:hypothetical protein [Agrococcus terreus]
MTWHRAGGPTPMDGGEPRLEDGIGDEHGTRSDDAPGRRVRPVEAGAAGAALRGLQVVTLTAAHAAVILLLVLCVVGILDEEIVGTTVDLQLLLRGALGALLPLVLLSGIGEPLRVAAERALLLRAAERATDRTIPPMVERESLRKGTGATLRGLGVGLTIAGAIVLPIGLMLATDDREALAARILLPTLSGLALAIGVALILVLRPAGAIRERWAARLGSVARGWTRGVRSTPRSHRQRRFRLLSIASGAVGVGAGVFALGVFIRQPGRFAAERTYDEAGELAIRGLLATGASIMGVAVAILLLGGAVLIARAALTHGRAVRALERGERVRLERIDAILLDDGPLERVAYFLGVVAWLALAVGWAPGWAALVEGAEAAAPLQPASALVAPAILALALALVAAVVGAARRHARRRRVHAVLARDPRAREEPSTPRNRRAEAVRDIALYADRSGI